MLNSTCEGQAASYFQANCGFVLRTCPNVEGSIGLILTSGGI